MLVLRDGTKVKEVKDGVEFWYENPCKGSGHAYSPVICERCGRDFCWSCGNGQDDGRFECPTCREWWDRKHLEGAVK